MAAGFEKLEKTRDRLGRVFSKRTKEPVPQVGKQQPRQHHQDSPSRRSPQPTPDPLIFPSPSFLRPTTSRMQAREERKVTVRSSRRAQSLPENTSSRERMPSIDESVSTSVASFFTTGYYPTVPKRSSSLFPRRRDPSLACLLEFSFPEKRSGTGSASVSSSGTELESPRRSPARTRTQRLSRIAGPLPIFSARQPATPPYSDNSSCASPSLSPFHINKPLPPPPPAVGVLTPEPSPELRPVNPETPIRPWGDARATRKMKTQRHRSLEAPEASIDSTASLRKTVSDSTLSKPVPAPKDTPVHEEPTVETFLSLSDDDIADGPPVTPPPTPPSGRFGPARLGSGRAPTFDLPPDPPVFQLPSPRSGSKRYSPLICLSSPLTSRPAKVAAFECTRIAQRFNFDLIYIVNLWPVNIGHSPTSSCNSASGYLLGSPQRARSRTPNSSLKPGRRRSSLTGRLLAGHGLANLQTPFMISSAAHAKILRQDGWVEWRDEFPSQDHFSRGYSRAFYAGASNSEAVATPTTTTTTTTPLTQPKSSSANPDVGQLSERRSHSHEQRQLQQQQHQRLKNRGIVFAAYRFPGPDGTTPRTDKAQLEALYGEAETLVEMLLDIHKTERSRLPGARRVEEADDTGPLPVRHRYEP